MRKLFLSVILVMTSVMWLTAANVKVTMNAVSTTMKLAEKTTGDAVDVGEPASRVYNFSVAMGTYVLTAYDTDGTTVNGTLEIKVSDDDLDLKVFTITTYATNSGWAYGTDYAISASAISREGGELVITLGDSKTAGRKTFLVLNGNTYFCDLMPSAARKAEGYTTLYKTGTVTANTNATGAIPKATIATVTAPADATVFVGRKTAHFVSFIEIPCDSTKGNVHYYTVAQGSDYNYRVSRAGGLTQGGVFSASATVAPEITVSDADFAAKSPKWIDHDVKSNGGYNVADLFLNINAQEHLKLTMGQSYDLLPLRNWEVVNSITANYFIEPDYHYTVTDLNGVESSSVVTVDADGTLHALGNGAAIVTVTYDAICLKGMAGGDYWSAIWPENTGVFVVTVGDAPTGINLGMTINETNTTTYKLAGTAYDADFDVLYFAEGNDAGYNYTFKPTGVTSVRVAYPTLGENAATYHGFGSEGVTYNSETGEYTVKVKFGKQIVQLTNASGVSEYQVLVGKPVHIEATAAGRAQTGNFQPGDVVTVQLSGLYHPANKLAGVHNFNATTVYKHEGTELKSASNQYTFCSAPTAQAVTVTLPADMDVAAASNEYKLEEGFIRAGGFGDPIGNHRNTSKKFGRGPNFTAISQTAIFGALPPITLPLRERVQKQLKINVTPSDAYVMLTDYAGNQMTTTDGVYNITTADYNYTITKTGYHTVKGVAHITDANEALTTINITMEAIDATDTSWDGVTTDYVPETEGDWYLIKSGYHMAWFASKVNNGTRDIYGKLMNDISLGGYNWTPAGGSTSTKAFTGKFDGQNHTIDSLYINSTATYQGLFGYVQGGEISKLTVKGEVTTTGSYAAGIAAYLNASKMTDCYNFAAVNAASNMGGVAGYTNGTTTIDRCANFADITATGNYAGGITANTMNKNVVIQNCYNTGNITGANYVAGITANMQQAATVKSVYNVGTIKGTGANVGAIRGHKTNGTFDKIFAVKAYAVDEEATVKTEIKTAEEFADGTVAHLLGAPFGQEIGQDPYPVLNDKPLYMLSVIGQNDTTTSFVTETTLPDTVWINNIYGGYFNAEGKKVTEVKSDTIVTLMIDVKPLTGAATFEERTFKPETAWYGDPDFADDENYWNSGDYIFSTYWDNWGASGIFYYDVTMANLTGKEFGWSNPYYDQYSAAGGAAEGKNYAVWYDNWYGSAHVMLPEPQILSGMAVTNNAWVVDAIKNGDGQSVEADGTTGKPFGKGDWLKLTVTGYDESETAVGTVDYYLADFRDTADIYEWTYAENWQWLDLTALDTVSSIGFSLTSSKHNSYGMSTPAYFCFDNIGGKPEQCRLGELTSIKGHADYIHEVTIIENGNSTLILTKDTILPDTVWINNIYGGYFNAEGQKVTEVTTDTTLYLMIDVKPLTGAATFEERTLYPETAWYGDPDFADDENYWNSGNYILSTYVDNWGASGIYYYDITMANLTGKEFSWTNPYYDQYSAAGGAAEGNNYAIWYYNYYGNANIQLTQPGVISGMAVTNNAWVVDAIKNGDGMSVESDGTTGKPFGKGDWLKLTVTGYDEEENAVSAIDYYLADFRDSADIYEWTYAENWQWIDLTALDTVSAIGFTLTSSKKNTYGMSTPAYFCFDNLGGKPEQCSLGELTSIKGHADYIHELTVINANDTLLILTKDTILPDTMWINNIYGAYFNAEGQKVTEVNSDTTVWLMIDLKPLRGAATFEERTLYPETAWHGDPDFNDGSNGWTSGDYIFSTYVDNWGASGIYYYDVTMANLTANEFSWTNPYYDQYSAAGGAAEGNNYAIWYTNYYGNADIYLAEPQTVSGIAVTNNAWVVDAIKNGDGMSVEADGTTGKPFGKGDWILLSITGYGVNDSIGHTIDYYLADFRDTTDTYDWTYAENWQWIDLTLLDEITSISFRMNSSKQSTYGMSTPGYFCFDNLGGKPDDCRLGELTHIKEQESGLDELMQKDGVSKIIRDGNILIIRNGKIYTTDGRIVR